MYYQFYEWNHAFLSPARAVNDAVRLYYRNPLNPLTHTEFGRQIAAAGDLFERMTRHYGKPEFGITETVVEGQSVAVSEKIVWDRPFCKLLHFEKDLPEGAPEQPNVVLVAPMSGHYATLLRGTVTDLLPNNNVYITDWVDARKVPLTVGRFNLDDFIDYVIDIVRHFRGDAHLVAVCQPAVPVLAATALLEQRQSTFLPRSITLMGGPIDTRQNPTEVNTYAEKHSLDWFRRNVIHVVPFPHPGVMRKVYPGFLQLTGFMTMNLDRHLTAHYDYFDHLVKGDGDSADKHREFYDEYLSVMDLTAEFYLQTVDTVFLRHALPKGEMRHRGHPVDPGAITRTPILTIEGEKDDISGIGQTRAAHTLTPNLPAEKHRHYEQKNVGHYGVFNGSRFRKEIAPRICEFVRDWDAAPQAEPASTPTGDVAATGWADTARDALAASESAARDIAIAADTLDGLADEAPAVTEPAATDTAPAAAEAAAGPDEAEAVAETAPAEPVADEGSAELAQTEPAASPAIAADAPAADVAVAPPAAAPVVTPAEQVAETSAAVPPAAAVAATGAAPASPARAHRQASTRPASVTSKSGAPANPLARPKATTPAPVAAEKPAVAGKPPRKGAKAAAVPTPNPLPQVKTRPAKATTAKAPAPKATTAPAEAAPAKTAPRKPAPRRRNRPQGAKNAD